MAKDEVNEALQEYLQGQQKLLEALSNQMDADAQKQAVSMVAEGKARFRFTVETPPTKVTLELVGTETGDIASLFHAQWPELPEDPPKTH